jgi:hypothetical protein
MEGWEAKRWRGLLTWWYVSHEQVVVRAGIRNDGGACLLDIRRASGICQCHAAYPVVRERAGM